MTYRARFLLAGLLAGLLLIASASYASAHEFIASKTGSVKGSGAPDMTFEFAAGAGEPVLCKKVSAEGSVTSLKAETLAIAASFSECEATTFLGTLSATVSPMDLTLNASGTVTLTKPVEVNIGGVSTQTIPAQGPLSGVTFTNDAGMITINFNVKGLESSGSLGSQTNGTITGAILLAASSGTLEWK